MFKKKKPYKRFFIIACLFCAIISISYLLETRVRPTLISISKIEVTQKTVQIINQTVQAELESGNFTYQDFITVQQDYSGKVALMQANTTRINRVSADIALAVQEQLRNLDREKVSIPAGQLLGSYFWATYGPRINVYIEPLGTVDVNLVDQFEQAGINQTRHKIYLDFTASVRVGVPLHNTQIQVVTTVPVAESIIVGDVPSAVINLPQGMLGK